MAENEFCKDWITTGWSRGPDGKWLEMSHSTSVVLPADAVVRDQIGVHEIAGLLNSLESKPTDARLIMWPSASGDRYLLQVEIAGLCSNLRWIRDHCEATLKRVTGK